MSVWQIDMLDIFQVEFTWKVLFKEGLIALYFPTWRKS
jgi:hypothetical protein